MYIKCKKYGGIIMDIREFEKWYNKINKKSSSGKGTIEYFEFATALSQTSFVEYHYSLIINKKTNEEFRNYLWAKFEDHKEAEMFLLKKLETNEDKGFQGKILFRLGVIIDRRNGKQKEKVLEYVHKLINSSDDNIRENAIIVLGWLGGINDIALLGEKLLNDPYTKCRAWSASSFMQIWFRREEDNIFAENVLPYLYKALQMEKNYFVISTVIETIQELVKKKFGITKMALNDLDKEKIDICANKIIKYFEKVYK
jgi:hypothetical protein